MPYNSIEAAKAAGFPTSAEGIPMTLAQVNKLASIYDSVKAAGTATNAMAVAWTQWKRLYKKEGDKWVTKEKQGQAMKAQFNIPIYKSEMFSKEIPVKSEWIPVAVPGQQISLETQEGQIVLTLTEEALIKSVESGSWPGGYINVNHEDDGEIDGYTIEDAKYEGGILYHKVSDDVAGFIRNKASSGRSIEAIPILIEDGKVMELAGAGLSVLYPPHKPACSTEMGCSSEPKEEKLTLKNKLISTIYNLFDDGNTASLDINKSQSSMEDNDMADKEIDKLTASLADMEKSRDEAVKEVELLKASLNDKEKQLTEQEALLKSYQEKEAEALDKLREDQWSHLKSEMIPPGLVAKEEDEKALKSEWENDPFGFSVKLSSFKNELPRKESGSEYDPKMDEQWKETEMLISELKESRGH